jgi:hypothetical protein
MRRGAMAENEADELREKGKWAETAEEGLVPPEDGADHPGDDPELGGAVTGRTTGDDEPATEGGVDLEGGDDADATSDGGPDLEEDAEPDLRDAGLASTEGDA